MWLLVPCPNEGSEGDLGYVYWLSSPLVSWYILYSRLTGCELWVTSDVTKNIYAIFWNAIQLTKSLSYWLSIIKPHMVGCLLSFIVLFIVSVLKLPYRERGSLVIMFILLWNKKQLCLKDICFLFIVLHDVCNDERYLAMVNTMRYDEKEIMIEGNNDLTRIRTNDNRTANIP